MITALPKEWIELLTPLLKDEMASFLSSYHQDYYRGIRRRCIDYPSEAKEAVPWTDAKYLPIESRIGATVLHDAGAYYLQEPSAMVPALVLDPKPDETILDLCAAPGGKSTQIGMMLCGKGLLVSNDPIPGRASVLSSNIERMGIPNAIVTCELPSRLSAVWQECFDRILVDAPCSGEGMFRRHPETIQEWSLSSVSACAKRQRAILQEASGMLKPGGTLVYSTCTFNQTENEGVIRDFLGANGEFTAEDFTVPGIGTSLDGMMHIWPHRVRGEGHFVAKLRKDGVWEQPLKKRKETKRKTIPGADNAAAFIRDDLNLEVAGTISQFKENLVLIPDNTVDVTGVRVLRMGLHLGHIAGNAFVPDHALAMLQKSLNVFPLSDTEAVSYMQGDTISCPQTLRGWLTPSYRGMNLGWAKGSGGMLKNHYPKGLRRLLFPND